MQVECTNWGLVLLQFCCVVLQQRVVSRQRLRPLTMANCISVLFDIVPQPVGCCAYRVCCVHVRACAVSHCAVDGHLTPSAAAPAFSRLL